MAIIARRSRWALGALALAVACGSSVGESNQLGASAEQLPLGACSKHSECEDENPCTQNLCAVGLCAPAVQILGCCFDGACFGAGGQPGAGGAEPFGCSTHEQCVDGDECTQNLCVLGLCTTTPVLGCVLGQGGAGGDVPILPLSCASDDACEDGHPCTENVCVVGLCTALPVLGCCFLGSCVNDAGGAGGTDTGGTDTGGTDTGGTDTGGTDTGGTDTGGTDTGAGSSSGGENIAGRDGNGAVASAGSDSDSAAGAGDDSVAGQTDWIMQGGSCSVSTPRSGSLVSLVLLAFALGAALGRRRQRLAALGLAAPLALGAPARAAGFAQDTYTAPVAPDDLMWTERAGSNAGHLRPFARLTLGYADDPLVLVDAADSSREIRVVDDQFAMYGAFGIGLAERAHLALAMPLFQQSTAFAGGSGELEGVRPGDLGIDGRVAILDRHAALELAVAATLRVPTGDQDSYASDGRASLWPRALLSKQLSQSGTLLNLSLGPVFRASNAQSSVQVGDQLRFAAGALLALSKRLGLTAEAAGSTQAGEPFERRSTPVEGALGGRLTLDAAVVGSTIGTGLGNGVGAPDFRWLVMLQVPGPVSRLAPAKPVKDEDPDRDRLSGNADACPDEPEDLDDFEDHDGCPEADDDHDGVLDVADKCSRDAEDQDGFQDQDGCPEADNDADGIADASDKCPLQPEDLDNWQDEDGCLEEDNDTDGLLDAQDKCPNEAETKNGLSDDDGCPDLLRVEEGQIRTLEPIFFDYNKARIQSRSEPLLVEMANLIRTRADLGVIAIEGHTDSRGSANYNLTLSRDRASAVRALLISQGVSEDRLVANGFGSQHPIEDNKTEAGRAKNRRVEFRFGLLAPAVP